jgi:hypothetical protein
MDIPCTPRLCRMRYCDLIRNRFGNIGGCDVGGGSCVRRRHRAVSRDGQLGDGYVVGRRGGRSKRRDHDRSTRAGDSFERPVHAVTAHGPLVRSAAGDRCTENVCCGVCSLIARAFFNGWKLLVVPFDDPVCTVTLPSSAAECVLGVRFE